jgi:chemotaxis protein MotB
VIQEKVADRDIGIEGHTDNEPIKHSGWKSNWELSTARATSVLHFLEEGGVNPRQMVASGYGEYRPMVSNDDPSSRQKNRRVEIVILPKELTKRERDLIRQAERTGEPDVVEKARSLEMYK